VRAASIATTREQFADAYLREWATWFTLPCQWTKERFPGTPVGIYGPQPFRRDYFGISGKSAQQIAMEAYTAKAEADQMMEDLKNHFIGEFGIAAWDQVLSHTTQIKKDMKAAALQAEKDQDELMHTIMVWGAVALAVIVVLVCVVLISIGLVHK
jgi:hypothetical protein